MSLSDIESWCISNNDWWAKFKIIIRICGNEYFYFIHCLIMCKLVKKFYYVWVQIFFFSIIITPFRLHKSFAVMNWECSLWMEEEGELDQSCICICILDMECLMINLLLMRTTTLKSLNRGHRTIKTLASTKKKK